ncbi:MAG: DUF5696 domain-containing protein [Clostridiales bacterium]|nr:DUF5696 domain-containing protein [Clostridiales bacterium]
MIKRFLSLSAALLLLAGLLGCGTGTPPNDGEQTQRGELVEESGLYTAAESDAYRLLVDMDQLNIYVENKLSGKRFSSNPADIDEDTVAGDDYKNYMRTQFEISYVYGRNVRTANSYEDCVAQEQYEIYRLDNGVRIEYTLGDISMTWEDIPEQLSASRTEKLILKNNSLSEKEQELFLACFEQQEDGSYLRKSNVFGSKQTDLIQIFSEIGYTQEDLRADCKEFDIPYEAEEKVGFVIPVEYTLENDRFRASVIMEDVRYPADSPILNIELLPFFGAYKQGTDGYTFMPDGSGVILDFARTDFTDMDLAVYHADASIGEPSEKNSAQPVLMPVFGMKEENSAFLAIVEEGDALSTLHASPAGKTCSYHMAYADFTVCAQDTMDLSSVTTVPTAVSVYQKNLSRTPLTVAYCFLEGADADYSGMARNYRTYLIEKEKIGSRTVSEQLPFYLETIGAIESSKNFMGINYTGVTPLTTYQNAQEMAEYFQQQGIERVILRLSGWYGSGVVRTIPKKVKTIGSLGSTKELETLFGAFDTYLDVSFISLDTAKGISPSKDAAKMLDQQYVRTFLSEDEEGYLVSVNRLPALTKTVLRQTNRYRNAGISVRDLGNAAYADYNKNQETDRQSGAELASQSLQTLSESGKHMMLEQANMRNFKYGSHILLVPTGGSNYRAGGQDVPFYQMVIHGLADYGIAPVNLSSTGDQDLLKAAEYGAGLAYQLSYTDLTKLNGVFAPKLFSVYYRNWMQDAVQKQTALSEVLDGLNAMQIVHHEYLTPECTATTYQDGTKIVVNYSDQSVTASGVQLQPRSFLRLDNQGGKQQS